MESADTIRTIATRLVDAEADLASLDALDRVEDGRRFRAGFDQYPRDRPCVTSAALSLLTNAAHGHFALLLDTARHQARRRVEAARKALQEAAS